MEVRGSVVLVTGASSGIGRATALAFDRAGARVALAARRIDRLEQLSAGMEDALAIQTDLAQESAARTLVDRTVAHFGRLDVLVNNAGAAVPGPSDQLDPDATRRLFEVNLIGAMVATRHAVPVMRRQGGGHIINVCSPAGFLGVPLMADYCASKAAMSGWTRCLQAEWAGSEIDVTEYLPGLIATELGQIGSDGAEQKAVHERRSSGTGPLAPLPPEHVAEQIVSCVRRPRAVVYSNLGTRILCWLVESSRLRRALGSRIGRAQRERLGLPVFSADPED